MGLYSKTIDLQKLQAAWKRVKKNHPSAGVDQITCEQFDEGIMENLKELHFELREHRYAVLPVKVVTTYKGEKSRKIALYSMRDKVVQQSLAAELARIYDKLFSSKTYAYRSDKSALSAAAEIDSEIAGGKYSYILKVDISSFFDSIRWAKLKDILMERIKEEDVIELIRLNTCTGVLDEVTGELSEKQVGVHQGSAIAPILSNVYLMDFDQHMEETCDFYIRYSDDMIVLGKSADELGHVLEDIARQLNRQGLKINEKKTRIASLKDGIDFLGYHFDAHGKSTPAKAEDNLKDRLETMWITSTDLGVKQKIKKALEIIGGWKQYFRDNRKTDSIFEYTTFVYAMHTDQKYYETLVSIRPKLHNIYKDICGYLAEVWKTHSNPSLEVLEYEQFYQLNVPYREDLVSTELLDHYRKFFMHETPSEALELMQSYTDLGEYERAAFWSEKKERLEEISEEADVAMHVSYDGSQSPIFTRDTAMKIRSLFVGREDIYTKETIDADRRRKTVQQFLPLTDQLIEHHLKGIRTLGSYIQRSNSTVHFIVIDIDVSRRVLLQLVDNVEGGMKLYLGKALETAFQVKKNLRKMGLNSYVEYSGYRGYHVWILFSEWIPTRYANMLCEVLEGGMHADPDIGVEFFPNKTRVRNGKLGQSMKIPFGVHVKSGDRSYFIDDSLEVVAELDPFLDSLARYTSADLKRILAKTAGKKNVVEKKAVDQDLSVFGKQSANIKEVLEHCNLMRYLCQKSAKTGYLTHFERLSVLYVFGHLGDDGKEFVHKVMSFTLNYNYNTTEHFIRRCPEKPISCVKLRDQYKRVTAEIGCSCAFKSIKNCYPSPVVHAIAKSDDPDQGITLPTSRSFTKEKRDQVISEMNIHKRGEELARQLLALKKQQWALQKKINRMEMDLSIAFDAENIDSLEMEMGVLVRRKIEDRYEWAIEM